MNCIYCEDEVCFVSDCYYEITTNDEVVSCMCELCFVEESPLMCGMKLNGKQITRIKCINL